MNPDLIRQLIELGLPGARVEVQGADGVHFEATVVSEAFAGKLPLARHRMVLAQLTVVLGQRRLVTGGDAAVHPVRARQPLPREFHLVGAENVGNLNQHGART